jgi:RsiW-degrading membrane proteinase PrsW (M82 family)
MLLPHQIYLVFAVLAAVCGAMLWIGYFKRIDVLEHERIIDVIIAFTIGYLTPSLALWIYYGLEILGFNFNGKFLNDLAYSVFGVGVTEELSKLLGVLITFKILKKRINEPIDYLIYGGIIALGFSTRENFIYYHNYGSQIATGRTLISCLVHIINTSICVYGLYRFKIFNKGNIYVNSIVGISAAIASHGMFDFFLTQPFLGIFTSLLATIVYLIGINFWLQMINNCINFSPFFDYQKISSITKLYKTIFAWYVLILILVFAFDYYYKDLDFAIKSTFASLVKEGVVLIIVALRASRLKINKRKYFPVKIQMPIHFTNSDDEDFSIFGIGFKIRGENEKEFQFIKYMGKDILIYPVNKNASKINTNRRARLLKKYFLKNDVVIYLIEVFNEDKTNTIYLLKPKTRSITYINGIYPIGILMQYESSVTDHKNHETLSYKDLKKIEYVYIKDLPD